MAIEKAENYYMPGQFFALVDSLRKSGFLEILNNRCVYIIFKVDFAI